MGTLALGLAVLLAAEQSPARDGLGRLSAAEPSVRWQEASRVRVDVDCDGKVDDVYLGRQAAKVYVGLLRAAEGPPSVLAFEIGTTAQAGICGEPASIASEALPLPTSADAPAEAAPGATHPRCRGIRLSGGECDSIHLFWNSKTKRLDWWRR